MSIGPTYLPTYLGRVQPYAVYVPTTYNQRKPARLTWILHSLGANLNQYGGVAPSQLQEECQSRNSICAVVWPPMPRFT